MPGVRPADERDPQGGEVINLEPIRAGVLMTWESLDDRERMIALYLLASLVVWMLGALQRRSRDNFRAEIVEELAARGAGSRD